MKNKKIPHAIDSVLSGYAFSAEQESALIQQILNGKRQVKKAFPRKAIATIICILLLLSLMVPAISLPELQMFRRSNDDILAYQVEMNKPMPGIFIAEKPSDNVAAAWGLDVADALIEMNAALHLPEWKPERFNIITETTIETDEIWGGHIYYGLKALDGSGISITVFVYPEEGNFGMTVHVQHDNTENEIWNYNGIEYNYVNNLGVRSVSWLEGNCWAQISGEASRDEMLRMIKSIND